MNRYDYQEWENDDGALEGWLSESETGDYCRYEEAHLIEVDRDIKAANLKKLVDMVLEYKEARDCAVGGPDHIDTYEADRLFDGVIALARGLKQ